MDLRRQEEERGCYNPSPSLSPAAPPPPPPPPPPIKDSAFSRPLLPLNSSLLQQGLQRGEARNGGSGYTVAPSSFSPLNFTGGGGRLKSPVSLISSSSNSNNRSILAAELTWHYRECQKNHAAGIGGHVLDGCCEFMPSDDVALKCAACGCHRSFHRRVSGPNPNGAAANHRMPPVQLLPPPPPPPSQSSSEELIGGTSCQSKKRFRTRFTPEQKEKMFKFAESLSWRFQKPDDAAIDEFCTEAGLNRQVLKVWMHNNKYTYKKQEPQHQPPQLPPQQEMPQEILPHQEPHQIPEHQQIA